MRRLGKVELEFSYEKLKVCVGYMTDKLNQTVLSDTAIPRVTIGQSTKLPQMIRRERTEDCLLMLLNNNTVQVNFLKKHQKVLIWAEDGENLYVTIIYTVGTETRAQTLSLSRDCSSQMPGEMRRILKKSRKKIKEFNQ